MKDKIILTAESVTEGHPDKLCDTIADSVLDACLEHDPSARVACEVMATAGKIIVAGEITAAVLPDTAATTKSRSLPTTKAGTLPQLWSKIRSSAQATRASCTVTPAMRLPPVCPCLWCWPTA